MSRDHDLGHRFTKSCAGKGAEPAIQYQRDGRWQALSYRELGKCVASLSAFLAQEGIRKGDRVAILLENRPEWPILFFAIVSLGAVAVPLDPEAPAAQIEAILKDCEPAFFFTSDGGLFEKASSLRRTTVRQVISVDSQTFAHARAGGTVESFPGAALSDVACLLYTSGTTAAPKGVMLTHGNLLANCDSLYELRIVSSRDSVVSLLPLHHIYPLTITMILPLMYGARIVYPASLRPEVIGEAMRETNPSVLPAVPQVFAGLFRKMDEGMKRVPFPLSLILGAVTGLLWLVRENTGINLARFVFAGIHRRFGRAMRLFVSGGAKLDEDVARGLGRLGFTIIEGYGLTETSPVLSFNPPKRQRIGSVGVAVPRVELRVVDRDERGIGEVVARGPNVMKGYYRRDDLTREAIRDGWFHTGDLGRIDSDGYLYLTGRSKDLIVLASGLNIYPEEIEEAYGKVESIAEICVFDVSEKGSSVLWAVVKPDLAFFKKYGEINLRNVIKERMDNISQSLPVAQRLKGFTIVMEDLPRTRLGKVKRYQVKEIYGARILAGEKAPAETASVSAEDASLIESAAGKKVVEVLKQQTDAKRSIAAADSLELDLGIDSLGRIELASALEAACGVAIQDETVGDAFTVRDLIHNVARDLAAGARPSEPGEKEARYGPAYWKRLFEIPPKEENLDKIDLAPGFLDRLGNFLFLTPFYLIFTSFFKLRIKGLSNIPAEGPCIFYANHTSYLDGLLVAASMPGYPRLDLFFVGFRPYFNVPIIRSLVKTGRIIPLDFVSHLLEALRSSYYVLKHGKCLCLFPEGMRTLDGKVGAFKKGFGILAKESGVPLVPVLISGAYEAWPRTSRLPRRHPITVRFGAPRDIESLEKRGLALGAADVYNAICLAAREDLTAMAMTSKDNW